MSIAGLEPTPAQIQTVTKMERSKPKHYSDMIIPIKNLKDLYVCSIVHAEVKIHKSKKLSKNYFTFTELNILNTKI